MDSPERLFPVETLKQEPQQSPLEFIILHVSTPEVKTKLAEPVVVSFGKIVRLSFGKDDTMSIYMADKDHPEKTPKDLPSGIAIVTEEKPVGKVILNKKEGDNISYENRGQTEKAKILEIVDYGSLPKAI